MTAVDRYAARLASLIRRNAHAFCDGRIRYATFTHRAKYLWTKANGGPVARTVGDETIGARLHNAVLRHL